MLAGLSPRTATTHRLGFIQNSSLSGLGLSRGEERRDLPCLPPFGRVGDKTVPPPNGRSSSRSSHGRAFRRASTLGRSSSGRGRAARIRVRRPGASCDSMVPKRLTTHNARSTDGGPVFVGGSSRCDRMRAPQCSASRLRAPKSSTAVTQGPWETAIPHCRGSGPSSTSAWAASARLVSATIDLPGAVGGCRRVGVRLVGAQFVVDLTPDSALIAASRAVPTHGGDDALLTPSADPRRSVHVVAVVGPHPAPTSALQARYGDLELGPGGNQHGDVDGTVLLASQEVFSLDDQNRRVGRVDYQQGFHCRVVELADDEIRGGSRSDLRQVILRQVDGEE